MPPISLNICSVESLIFSFTLTTHEGEMDVIGNPVWEVTEEQILCMWTTEKEPLFSWGSASKLKFRK